MIVMIYRFVRHINTSEVLCAGKQGTAVARIKYLPENIMSKGKWLSCPTYLDIWINGRNTQKPVLWSMLLSSVIGLLGD